MSTRHFVAALAAIAAAAFSATPGQAQQFLFLSIPAQRHFAPPPPMTPPAEQPADEDAAQPANLQRQIVSYPSAEMPGTVIVDTPHTYLYFVLGNGKAVRYGIGVGRQGFAWSGVKTIERKTEWPDWYPPAEMVARQPYLPRMVAGGPGNPLGARAMYIAGTEYRIHGTNDPSTIGKRVSSGCIRMTNGDAIDLYNRVHVGTKVIVLPQNGAPMRETRVPGSQAQAAIPASDQPSSTAVLSGQSGRTSWNLGSRSGLY